MRNPFLALYILLAATSAAAGQKDPDPKTMTVPEGKALIYIVRPETFGLAIKMVVTLNGAEIGMTKGKTYLYKVVDPGDYLIGWKVNSNPPEPLRIMAKSGEKYYIWQDIQEGKNPYFNFHGTCEFKAVGPDEGMKKLNKCKLGVLF